jgi:diguanylate cyclase (GGDEF)-like protein
MEPSLGGDLLDRLMPMHLRLDAVGSIRHAGPTLERLLGPGARGQNFFRRFRVLRPTGIVAMPGLVAAAGATLALAERGGRGLRLRGQAHVDGAGGVVLGLSFGLGVVEAVRCHGLTQADFGPSDLAVELLFLVEANRAVTEEFRHLSHRLEAARRSATAAALTDVLTGLANRRGMALALEAMGSAAFALMQLDLDRFKQVNDRLGHAAGDALLQEVARLLQAEMRAGDTVARMGGDEFLILLPGMRREAEVGRVAARIIDRLSQPIRLEAGEARIGTSIGMVLHPGGRPALADLLAAADAALYAAKAQGRGRAVLAT